MDNSQFIYFYMEIGYTALYIQLYTLLFKCRIVIIVNVNQIFHQYSWSENSISDMPLAQPTTMIIVICIVQYYILEHYRFMLIKHTRSTITNKINIAIATELINNSDYNKV